MGVRLREDFRGPEGMRQGVLSLVVGPCPSVVLRLCQELESLDLCPYSTYFWRFTGRIACLCA